MRRFIKEHPWRLEIVPLVILTFAAVGPLIYRRQALARTRPEHSFTAGETWLLNYLVVVLFVAVGWMARLQLNHSWARDERGEKRINSRVPLTAVALAVWAFCSALTSGAPAWVLAAWIVLVAAAAPVQALLERSRQPIAAQIVHAPKIPPSVEEVRPGEPFYYREVPTSWGWGALETVLTLYVGVATWWLTGREWVGGLAAACIVGVSVLSSGRASFVVSNERIRARIGLDRVSIPIGEVRSCSLYEPGPPFEPGWFSLTSRTHDGMRLYELSTGAAPMLLIETIDGRGYLFGLRSPETACKLIQAALAVRQQDQGT